ncbi:transglutaminase family protein [Amorphus orientalis]|uniref:Transglutaminase-like putative cysteine protease n=1 Tax=Amorphus orientalis TaxID=649198 RepID=A0AAE3VRD1_9HYPH|nr:transglutaminase family protein [Amorphus orientalis]MDQ0316435.1 transglutaminase-like putative cysteine protease [Amorphus orientalis]
MKSLHISHHTRYAYDQPVTFGRHRLMLRPRDGHDMRILSSSLIVEPEAQVRWAYDTFGNSIALLDFAEPASRLVVKSELYLERYGLEDADRTFEPHAITYPFSYDSDERIDLAPLLLIQCPEDRPIVSQWLEGVMPEVPDNTFTVLDLLSSAIHDGMEYRRRDEEGVQTPAETITGASGTCRDFAFLFMEAARDLGFATRFVTGYLYDQATDENPGLTGGGATHAWAEVFIPGVGWVEFDPTNEIVAGNELVRVATTRTPEQAQPVGGSFSGGAFLGMEIEVAVTSGE